MQQQCSRFHWVSQLQCKPLGWSWDPNTGNSLLPSLIEKHVPLSISTLCPNVGASSGNDISSTCILY
eukprot:1117132-Prorocentrum_lima.AAC.1